MVKVDYDYKWDILYVYKEVEKAKFSVEVLDNFVVDIGFKGEVVALEILNASRVLKVSKKELKEIKTAKLATLIKGEFYWVMYSLQFNKASLESELQIPVGTRLR